MADPLTALVDREAPAPTNFFDPAAGQSILSRYSNARMAREPAEDLARSAGRLTQGRLQARDVAAEDRRMEREKLLQDREDAEFEEKKLADASRMDFLATLNDIKPEAEDFDTQVVDFMKQLPPSLTEDPAVKTILSLKAKMADDTRSRKNAAARYQASRENALTLLGYKDTAAAARAGVTPEEIEAAINPETGETDLAKLNQLRGNMERKTKDDEFTRRQGLMQQNRLALIDARDLSKKGKERRANVERFIVEDTAAFPSRTAALTAAAGGKKTLEDLKLDPKTSADAIAAEQWDKNKLQKELSAAYAYQDPDDYVELVEGLSDSQKARRRQVWEHAHRDETFEETGTTPPAPEGVVEDYVPPKAAAPLPKDQWIVGKRYRGADGSTRTYKGDGKWE
jgi:hypothetical protein